MIPFILKYVTPRDYVIGALVVALIACVTRWHSDNVAHQKAKLVYENPAIKTVEKIVYVAGPVRTRTVVIKQSSGVETTTIDEERAPVTAEVTKAEDSQPVPLAVALAEPRTDRYLLSFGLNRLTPDMDGKAVLVGYGFKNRLDVMAGGVNKDGWSPWVFATLRF